MNIQHGFFASPTDPEKQIFVIGDIHGDLGLLLCLLHDCAQVIDKNLRWKKHNTSCVVLLGDMVDRNRPGDTPLRPFPCPESDPLIPGGADGIDRGPGEITCEEILIQLYLIKLQSQALQEGGYIVKIIGNHELMNIDDSVKHTKDPQRDNHYAYTSPLGRHSRQFFPLTRGSLFAQALMTSNAFMILQLGVWVFVHGGISGLLRRPHMIHKINQTMRTYFLDANAHVDKSVLRFVMQDSKGIAWDRTFGFDECDSSLFQRVLKAIHTENQKLGRFVRPKKLGIGHCTQVVNEIPSKVFSQCTPIDVRTELLHGPTVMVSGPKGICSGCSENVYRLDSAMSRAFDTEESIEREVETYRLPQLLEVRADGRVIGVRRLSERKWKAKYRGCSNFPPWLKMSSFRKIISKW